MPETKNKLKIFKKLHLQAVGILLLILLALLLLWFNNANSYQSLSAMMAQVRFEGEYRIGDGQWKPITEGQHISSTNGDVTLRGNFHLLTPDGEYVGIYDGDTPIAFYLNHINVSIRELNSEQFDFGIEGSKSSGSICGIAHLAYPPTAGNTDPIEILIHNPHSFGNENAIDEMLSGFALWAGLDFERDMMESGQVQRNMGLVFMIVAFVLLGSALLSALLHIQTNGILWLIGATILSAGLYLAYSAPGVSFWRESITECTSVLGFSMMFYMLFLSAILTVFLKNTKKIGAAAVGVLGAIDAVCLVMPIIARVHFYDTWLYWIMAQSLANILLLFCAIKDFIPASKKSRWILAGMVLPILAFQMDVIATVFGRWESGFISKYVFFVLFIIALFVVLRIIPENINAAARAKELEIQRSRLEAEKNIMEAQLKESRISIMLSQIQPHFIYNTLGTIERMCLRDPPKAFELVRNFSLYLRGNFSELDSVAPIPFSEEMQHIEYYVNIEKVRFPDMNIEYNVEAKDFLLPALSVQPLVENAIKHGLMRLESGGKVLIHSYETSAHFCVEVTDDGVGFDTDAPIEEKKHVGLRNIRGRLKAMVNGELIIESEIGKGTKALITIPKEVTT